MSLVFFLDDHPFLELRDELGHGIIQADFAFVHQHHDGCAGEHFGHRSDPEDVVFADRFLRLDIGIAQQIPVVNLAVLVGNDADDARQLIAVQVWLHGRRDFGAGGWLVFSGEACSNDEHSRQQECELRTEGRSCQGVHVCGRNR